MLKISQLRFVFERRSKSIRTFHFTEETDIFRRKKKGKRFSRFLFFSSELSLRKTGEERKGKHLTCLCNFIGAISKEKCFILHFPLASSWFTEITMFDHVTIVSSFFLLSFILCTSRCHSLMYLFNEE